MILSCTAVCSWCILFLSLQGKIFFFCVASYNYSIPAHLYLLIASTRSNGKPFGIEPLIVCLD